MSDRIVREFGRKTYQIHRAGGVTLSQAMDAAFTSTNPQNRALITAAIISGIIGESFEDVRLKRHQAAFEPVPGELKTDA